MDSITKISDFLHLGDYANNLHSCSSVFEDNNRLEYYRWQAKKVGADYFYCINSNLENVEIPFVYIYDERRKSPIEYKNLKLINKQIWTVGEIPFAIIVYDYEIKIIDARQHIKEKTGEANIFEEINIQDIEVKLKQRILDGLILEESEADYIKVSPYQILLKHVEENILKKASDIGCDENLLKQLLVKFILIKYLEEQKDDKENSVFQEDYFSQFANGNEFQLSSFCDVLRYGNTLELLIALNNKFNGGIFKIETKDELSIQKCDFSCVADALDGSINEIGQISIWKLYDFNLLPIEFISRLYERFVTSSEDEKQKGTGAFYTPPHLARLLVDELLPLNSNLDFNDFKILDPSCGSGIFLVLAYKRLITLWMLSNNKQKIEGRKDIESIKNLLSNSIYGVDINEDALSITATSLQIELTSHVQPKEIWDTLVYDNLTIQDNLCHSGFYKWYRLQQKSFNIIVGNPPFKISDKENETNIISGKDLDFKAERYLNLKNKNVTFPQNNPALSILYNLLTYCLKSDGILLLILPATATIYNSNTVSRSYLQTILTRWNIAKIYDFTPLRGSLWNKAAVATIAMLIKPKEISDNLLQHIIIRNTNVNKQGCVRFQIDKYDSFYLYKTDAIQKPYIWKSNLMGGGRITYLIEKYRNTKLFTPLANLPQIKSKKWIMQDGAKSSLKEGKDIAKKKIPLLVSIGVKSDELTEKNLDFNPNGLYRLDNENLYHPPNLIIKCNVNQGLPTIYNSNKTFIFDNTFLGLKAFNDDCGELLSLATIFKASRKLYKFLITTTSSKTFLQKGGNSIINSNDIKRLPVIVDDDGVITTFERLSEIEEAIIEDTELMAKSLDNISGPLFKKVSQNNIEQFCKAFIDVLNFVYEDDNNKFRPCRQIITDDFIWVSFQHSNKNLTSIEKTSNETNKIILQQIIKDEDSNKGLTINRIITYYNEQNTISFLKPNRLKYWTRSIGYRDAENVKADMFIKGY